jgi:hypothetical protein
VPFRGVYHFLTHDDAGAQMASFARALAPFLPLLPGEFLALDWEKSGGTEVSGDVLDAALNIAKTFAPDRPVWIYGYYGMVKRLVSYYPDNPRWLASGDVPERSYEVGAVLDQYGIAYDVPGIPTGVDVNRIIDYPALVRLTLKETNEVLDLTQTVQAHPGGDRTKSLETYNLHDYLVYLLDCANNAERSAAAALAAVQSVTVSHGQRRDRLQGSCRSRGRRNCKAFSGMTALVVALISGSFALLGTWLEVSRRQNKNDHERGYSLLQSIDQRTQKIDTKVDKHGERLAVVETKIEHLEAE